MASTLFHDRFANNQLLTRLPLTDRDLLESELEPVDFTLKQVLYRAQGSIDYVYFPTRGVVSAMTVLSDGRAIEVATIGHEGMVGLAAFVGGETSPNEVMVQVKGAGMRLKVSAFRRELARARALRDLLVRYHTAYSAQVSYAVACNGLHTIEPRC